MIPKYPSYNLFTPSSHTASLVKQKVNSTHTKPEVLLRKQLWELGLRYRVYPKNIDGKPDLVLCKQHLLIFCDGAFWHGRNWNILRKKLLKRANPDYWIPKIKANIVRDRSLNKHLSKLGWTVIRIWEYDILNQLSTVINSIQAIINRRKDKIKLLRVFYPVSLKNKYIIT